MMLSAIAEAMQLVENATVPDTADDASKNSAKKARVSDETISDASKISPEK